LIQYHKTS